MKALVIKSSNFANHLIQGPLAGVSTAPFRRLAWRYSQPAFCYTEMISCKTLLYSSPASITRFTTIDPQEGPVCFQLSGSDPFELSEATKMVADLGASLIDLNCGCPVKKIRNRGAGSRLLSTPTLLYQLVSAMKQSTELPVIIKIRVQGRHNDFLNRDIATAIQDGGADAVVVHGRHWTEHYETPCRYDEIRYFVENMNIPVIGNGDVRCQASLNALEATGCAGIMASRTTVGQPWLIRQLLDRTVNTPPMSEIGNIFIEHVQSLCELLQNEKQAVLQARKLAKYYSRPLAERAECVAQIQRCEALPELMTICHRYFT